MKKILVLVLALVLALSCFTALGLADACGRLLSPVMGPLLGCSGTGSAAFLLGLLGGYPVGGRTVGQLYESGAIDRGEAEHLLAFCNNCGPSFVLGIAGVGCFGSTRMGVYLYLIHVTAAVLVAQLHRRPNTLPSHLPARAPSPPGPRPWSTSAPSWCFFW